MSMSVPIDIDEFRDETRQFPFLWDDSDIIEETPQSDTISDIELESLPVGPEVHFEIEDYDFNRLVQELVELEHEHEVSSLEVFSQFVHGELDPLDRNNAFREWLSLYFLYLGTHEVRRFSCPITIV